MTTQSKVYYRNALLACFFLFTAVISSNFNSTPTKPSSSNEPSLYQARNIHNVSRVYQAIHSLYGQKQVLASPNYQKRQYLEAIPLRAQGDFEKAPLLLAYSIYTAAR